MAHGLETIGGDIVSGVNTALHGAGSLAGTVFNDLHDLGTTAVDGLTAGVLVASADFGGPVADGVAAVGAGAATAAHTILQSPVVQQAENLGSAAVHAIQDGIQEGFHHFFGRRLLENPEQYLADLDFLEELKTTDHGLTILQEANEILQLKGHHKLAATPLRRHLLTAVEAHGDSNPVIQRLYTYSGLHGSSRKLLSFSDVVSSVTSALASGTLYEHNNPLTAPTCKNINVDDAYPAN